MSLGSTLASFQFDTGSGLATIASVISCEPDLNRAVIDDTPIGVGYQSNIYGVFRLVLNVTIAYRKADHQKLTDQLVLASASKAAKYISQSGDEMTGNVKISNFRVTAQTDTYQVATFTATSDGAWVVNGQTTV